MIQTKQKTQFNMVDMALLELEREGYTDNWTSKDFWKRYITIYEWLKRKSKKQIAEILTIPVNNNGC